MLSIFNLLLLSIAVVLPPNTQVPDRDKTGTRPWSQNKKARFQTQSVIRSASHNNLQSGGHGGRTRNP